MIRKSGWLKYMRDQKLTAFIPSASLLSSLPRASLFICFISCCALSRCWNAEHEKKKMKKFKKKKKTFLTFCSTSLPLYNPLSGSSSKSNLAHVSILTPSPPFTSLPHPSYVSFFPSLIPFFFHYDFPPPSLLHLFLITPLAFVSPPSHSWLLSLQSLPLSLATWKATCVLIARGEGGQRVN